MTSRIIVALFAAAMAVPAACTGGNAAGTATNDAVAAKMIAVTITSATTGTHHFEVEPAKTAAEQERGLMFRTDIPKDGGMLFWPYPAGGGPPREASFWMKNTPSPLDIIYIRPDHTIARIAENTTPYSTDPIGSGEPVGAVLELRGGRTAELGIGENDRVTWPGADG
ncbi:DUF192 domain-containing protein [Hephaestia sp. GCM10023244]|uniref:DUF192 domain-containing protein n=1 Tax=unclassified Hephaestia TaxID=2631281 RepID=UPI0020778FB5|nr:DUF192 domain-containing protein [Hephaestia sp. MAHUQ-44]MCM8730727.1 DUF192 domain-containing protein [Hephaestia sp. MAHUQ-44]